MNAMKDCSTACIFGAYPVLGQSSDSTGACYFRSCYIGMLALIRLPYRDLILFDTTFAFYPFALHVVLYFVGYLCDTQRSDDDFRINKHTSCSG